MAPSGTLLLKTSDNLINYWSEISDAQSLLHYQDVYDINMGWDMFPLQELEDEQAVYFKRGNWARRSVTVDHGVYYAHEVNYFVWGVLQAEANKRGAPNSEAEMERWIRLYRHFRGAYKWRNIEHDGTISGRLAWAKAGWNYSMTGAFHAPFAESLPFAFVSSHKYQGPDFEVFIGDDVLPLRD